MGRGAEESSKATAQGAAGKNPMPGLTLFFFGYKGNAFGSFGDKRTTMPLAGEMNIIQDRIPEDIFLDSSDMDTASKGINGIRAEGKWTAPAGWFC